LSIGMWCLPFQNEYGAFFAMIARSIRFSFELLNGAQ